MYQMGRTRSGARSRELGDGLKEEKGFRKARGDWSSEYGDRPGSGGRDAVWEQWDVVTRKGGKTNKHGETVVALFFRPASCVSVRSSLLFLALSGL